MPKFLIEAGYTPEGVKGLRKDGASKRRQVVEAMLKELGGKLESLYFTFGDTDVVCVVDLPDNVSSAAMSLAVNASGLTTLKTTPLLTIDEMDAAIKKQPGYRGPGQ